MFKLPQRIMAGQKGPNGPKEEKKKGIIEEAGQEADPRVDAGGILLWQSLMVDDDFRWLNDPIVHIYTFLGHHRITENYTARG